MSAAAREFAQDPCSSVRRGNMVRAARNLLSAVTRLLILADKIDVHLLLAKLHRVEADLENLKNVSSQAELMESIKRFGVSAQDLMNQVQRADFRQNLNEGHSVICFKPFFRQPNDNMN